LFDVDGTLIRTHGAGVKAFERTLAAEFQVSQGTDGVQFAGRTDPSIVRELFQRHRIEPSPVNFERFFDRYVFWLDYLLCKSAGEVCVGVRDFISGLAALTPPPLTGLLTGNIRLGAEIKLRHFRLWEAFRLGAFGDDHEDRNQLAVLAQQRASQLLGRNLAGNQIVVVGDTPLDIDCARAISAKSLAVATGGYSLGRLRADRPTWAIGNLSEVTAKEICQ
jgi:phosphoglycolate phosphatase-like HAD superfamily hydrolase